MRHKDGLGDVVARPADRDLNLPFDPDAHRLADLIRTSIGLWEPDSPTVDLFDGNFRTDGEFLHLELEVKGLVNPPGIASSVSFDPFAYGDNPVYGFVEIDVDRRVATGGELDLPELRYLGNVARFGGKSPRGAFFDRVAIDASAFDDDVLTAPFVDRHGEEFHLALLGAEVAASVIVEVVGDGDGIFESDEIWQLTGAFFHRAHGFEAFSFATGGRTPGGYTPTCTLQFEHDSTEDATEITLVFPLTQAAAGLMAGEAPEVVNQDGSDQFSVFEALDDLQFSADFHTIFPSGLPEEDLIIGWGYLIPAEYLDPTEWNITVILGSSYTSRPSFGLQLVWTDVWPDPIRGDMDGDGQLEDSDGVAIAQFISANDAADGLIDGSATIVGFANDFSVFDLNYDGVVDGLDLLTGDSDFDDDVDLADFATFQRCFAAGAAGDPACSLVDFGGDDVVGVDDVRVFTGLLVGPS